MTDQFKNFIFQQINLTTPAARAWWEKRFPDYTQEYREGWAKRLKHMEKMGNMIINGVQSTGDLFYLFLTAKGLNPVAYTYNGPPNASQVEQLFNMYQQTFNGQTPNELSTPALRTGNTLGAFGNGNNPGSAYYVQDIAGNTRRSTQN